MANPEHLEILRQGVEDWNSWRREEHLLIVEPDLRDIEILDDDLRRIDFARVNLRGAKIFGASLSEANLSNANLRYTYIDYTDLSGANLKKANLVGAHIRDSLLEGADFTNAEIGWTTFSGIDLSVAEGVDTLTHRTPSTIALDTIIRSGGKLSQNFLRGCGFPDEFITYLPSLLALRGVIQFYSCFISYSSKDQEFADRLHSDLQAKGVRVWFASHDMKIGARIRPTIDESIRVYDKLLLVLSEHSVSSQWVEQEVETALRKERQSGGTVLFPVRLDDTVLKAGEGWPALVKDTRHVGDFTRWKEHDSYRKAFDRLLRDLKAEA